MRTESLVSSGADRIEEAVAALRAGEMIIVVDDEDRENEGDLVMAAEHATPETINFMITHARGLLCVALTNHRADELALPMMVTGDENNSQFGTAFTVSVDARHGTTTGISAHERAHTVQTLLDPEAEPSDLVRPGHVFPLRARDGGVLVRAGHTEAAVDLARLAGVTPAGVICEILSPDGTMARLPQLEDFAAAHDMLLVTIEDLIALRAYRRRHAPPVRRSMETYLPTEHGTFRLIGYRERPAGKTHLALVMGNVGDEEPALARIHSECLTGDVFGSQRCDCGEQLSLAMQRIGQAGRGIMLYLRQEGRGIGLHNKLRAYALQDQGFDTIEANRKLGLPADSRDYTVAAHVLRELGVETVRLMTNNPAKIAGLCENGVEVVERVPVIGTVHASNRTYLQTKQTKLGHLLDL